MNEQLIQAIEALGQLPDEDQSTLATYILQEVEKKKVVSPVGRPLTGQEFIEKLYREGKVLNIPTRKPWSDEERAKRARLLQSTAGGKPLSEIVIEGRGPY